MTVGTTLNVAKLLTDGVATEFPYSFLVFEKEHLSVLLRDDDGVVLKTYAQNEFSVSGLGQNTGTVTIVPAPATGNELLIIREVPMLQDTDIVNQGGFFPEVIERQLDLIVMQAQQLKERLNRAVVSQIGDEAFDFGAIDDGEFVQLVGTTLQGTSLAEISAPSQEAAQEAQGYVAALVTYTFGYIGIDDDTPPDGVEDGEGYVYTMDGRVFGAINDGGVADVKFELLTKALADEGGPGNGTVVSVAGSGGTTGLTFSGGPITSTGTLTLGGTLAIAHGGTGAATAAGARTALSAAQSGVNADITSLRQSTTVAATGTAAANSLGFRGLPISAQATGSAITLGLDDFGKLVLNTNGGWVVPANASVSFPRGSVVVLYNDSGSTQTVSITSDTLRWAGTASTGTRTVAQRGYAVLTKVKDTEWTIEGNIT
jgi:hypothetical protein